MKAYEQSTLFGSFESEIYNSLADLEPANNTLLGKCDAEEFFEKAGNVICDYNLQGDVAICLLHKHNFTKENEIMLESRETIANKPALVMEPLVQEGITVDYTPVVWKFSSKLGLFSPLEHTTESSVKTKYKNLMKNPAFLADFRDLLLKFNYEDIIGLSILRVTNLEKKEDEIYVERSHPTKIANVVMADYVPEAASNTLIQTNWSFEREWNELTSQNELACKIKKTCQTFCQPVGTGQKHLKSHQSQGSPHVSV